jgi:hypothetical protein
MTSTEKVVLSTSLLQKGLEEVRINQIKKQQERSADKYAGMYTGNVGNY